MGQHVTGVLALLLWFAVDRSASQHTNCSGDTSWIGDGFCDSETNNVGCAYDGGDCCSCTCVDGIWYSCGSNGFNCSDPACPNADPSAICTGRTDWLGDGWCDRDNNNLACGFDGGDCCACTCMDGLPHSCGVNGFECHDEACADPAIAIDYPNCVGNLLSIGDGSCSKENNNEACGYDGGDCCLCTCRGSVCGIAGFDCSDPGADDEFYCCKPPPPTFLPCPEDGQRVWVVRDTTEANALAEGVSCSGGSFDVLWDGKVFVDKTIHIFDGTVLNVTGVGSHVSMEGNSTNRILTVVNASVHLTGVNVSYGAGFIGGAIAVLRSNLTLDRSTFFGNAATGYGGAVYAADRSAVSFVGHTIFSHNTAGIDGGAVFVADSSCSGVNMTFFNNTAGGNGGAVMATDNASLVWRGNTIYHENHAEGLGGAICTQLGSATTWITAATFQSNRASRSAGALALLTGSSAFWLGETIFNSNSARHLAGALLVRDSSNVGWNTTTFFISNRSGFNGGAIFVYNGSGVIGNGWTMYVGNSASRGGAMDISGSSTAVYGGNTEFWGNIAEVEGGAVYVYDYSSAAFNGDTVFSGNSAGDGGAVLAALDSTISFGRKTAFRGNLAAIADEPGIPRSGGGVAVTNSTLTFSGETVFAENQAQGSGGAVDAFGATVIITGKSSFLNNSAGTFGGAVSWFNSNIVVDGNTTFRGNIAEHGGAFGARGRSDVEWGGVATFTNNSALFFGGAFSVDGGSNASFSATMTLDNNHAIDTETGSGGGVSVTNNARVFWSGKASFINNSADVFAGAVLIWSNSSVYWSGDATYYACSAAYGAALFVGVESTVEWIGSTEFTSNSATTSGGAVGSDSTDGAPTSRGTTILINGPTVFANNTAAAAGGGLWLNGRLSVTFQYPGVLFVANSAGVAGGAVFVSGIGDGPRFSSVRFVSNFAGAGGGVFITGSGNEEISAAGVRPRAATEFDGCQFIHNRATATGGAIESVAGQDYISNSSFVGNTASVGGAVRLAGKTVVDNCSFEDNRSGEGDGPAIENVGVISVMKNSSFSGNVFLCEPGKYLDFNEAGDIFDIACKGCGDSCGGCTFEEARMVPVCTQVMEHATSAGGATTLRQVSIDRGFWRATSTSTDVLSCYRADACLGGVTGSSGYCRNGYEGQYCSICSDGYAEGFKFVCNTCPDKGGAIVFAVVLTVFFVIGAAAVASYTMSIPLERSDRRTMERMARFIPLQSLKIVIVALQIVTQFTSIANVTFPHVYQRFLDTVNFINFDLVLISQLFGGCLFNVGIHGRLLIATIGPIIAAVFLGLTYFGAARRSRGSAEAIRVIRHKHVSMVLWLTFLVYSSVSSIIFQMFACDDLADGRKYLRADYRVECDSPNHVPFQIYAGLMMLLYTVGIPTIYTSLLLPNRAVLIDEVGRETNQSTQSFSDLWKPYKPSVFYYEVIECCRRVLLTGAVVFIYPNTSAQIALTLVIAVFFGMVSEGLSPFASRWDTWISRMGHVVVYASMYVALLLKVDVSDERSGSQKIFEVVLVAAHLGMILAVVVETGVMLCSFCETVKEEIFPRFRETRFAVTR